MDKINSGQGTLGQLMVNPQLYEALTGATREFQSLAKDIRANPKKFLLDQARSVLMARKLLVVNADDFGFTPDVNQGIVEAHRDGILTATTLMANGDAFDDAVRLAGETPSLDIGAHLVLIGGVSLVTGRPYPATVPQLVAALLRREIRPYDELRAQVRRIQDAGIRPTHFDTHKHTHLAPPVLDAVARLAEEFGVRWVRRPFRFSAECHARRSAAAQAPHQRCTRPDAPALSPRPGAARLPHHGPLRRLPDHRPLPNRRTGRADGAIPAGSTELMCHPGRCGDALRAARPPEGKPRARTRKRSSRQKCGPP